MPVTSFAGDKTSNSPLPLKKKIRHLRPCIDTRTEWKKCVVDHRYHCRCYQNLPRLLMRCLLCHFCIFFISKPEILSVANASIQVWHGYLPYRVLWGLLVPQSLLPLQLLITNMSCHYCLVRVMGSCYYYHFLATLPVCGFVWKQLNCFTRVLSFGNGSVLSFRH